jgi:hypothetical protein
MSEDFIPRITIPDTYDRVTVIVALRSQVDRLTESIEHGERHNWAGNALNIFRDDRDRAVELLSILTHSK